MHKEKIGLTLLTGEQLKKNEIQQLIQEGFRFLLLI